jgi:hypothetical protein
MLSEDSSSEAGSVFAPLAEHDAGLVAALLELASCAGGSTQPPSGAE